MISWHSPAFFLKFFSWNKQTNTHQKKIKMSRQSFRFFNKPKLTKLQGALYQGIKVKGHPAWQKFSTSSWRQFSDLGENPPAIILKRMKFGQLSRVVGCRLWTLSKRTIKLKGNYYDYFFKICYRGKKKKTVDTFSNEMHQTKRWSSILWTISKNQSKTPT